MLSADVPVLIVGGITPQTMQPWYDTGAQGFGLGSALYKPARSVAEVLPQARNLLRHFARIRRLYQRRCRHDPELCYGEHRRYGEAVSTAFAESTVNQVIAKRFAKKQQMQWTPRGIHLLVQLRVRTFTGTFANDVQWRRDARKAA